MRLIHYGAPAFDYEMFDECGDIYGRNKPSGGLWASPVDSNFGWREWCTQSNYGLARMGESFEFDLIGRILTIDCYADLELLPWLGKKEEGISFQAMTCACFTWDAVYLTERGQQETHLSHPYDLYGWDCESVLVMNRDCIVPCSKEVAA